MSKDVHVKGKRSACLNQGRRGEKRGRRSRDHYKPNTKVEKAVETATKTRVSAFKEGTRSILCTLDITIARGFLSCFCSIDFMRSKIVRTLRSVNIISIYKL